MKRTAWKLLSVIIIAILTAGCAKDPVSNADKVDVGIFNGQGVWSESVTSITQAVRQFGYSYELFQEEVIFEDRLGRYLIIILPGGDPRDLAVSIGPVGYSRITGFVMYGGSLIGLGGGASIVGKDTDQHSGMGILRGSVRWPVDRIALYPDYTITGISLFDPFHNITENLHSYYWTMYRWGPEFIPEDPLAAEALYTYDLTNTPAVIAFKYGAGRVFLSGCQLEFEENSDRDSTDFGAELNDPDSEWELLENALRYCYELE